MRLAGVKRCHRAISDDLRLCVPRLWDANCPLLTYERVHTMDEPKGLWLFYFLQNEKGESSAHPNACRMVAPGGRPRLQDVLDAFPLSGTGSFHFRFQVTQDKEVMFLDILGAGDPVPLVGGNVIAKVLRLGACWGRASPASAEQKSEH